jgi:NAD-dependent dihydropyrimidine dehydrogenase PreA subunit
MIAHLFEDLCTGCNACVATCPTHVLDPSPTGGAPVIARQDQCQTCFMCELYCPADAIFVGAEQTGPETIDPAWVRASGLLGQMRRDHLWDAPQGDLAPLEHYWRLGPFLQAGGQISADRYARRHAGDPATPS